MLYNIVCCSYNLEQGWRTTCCSPLSFAALSSPSAVELGHMTPNSTPEMLGRLSILCQSLWDFFAVQRPNLSSIPNSHRPQLPRTGRAPSAPRWCRGERRLGHRCPGLLDGGALRLRRGLVEAGAHGAHHAQSRGRHRTNAPGRAWPQRSSLRGSQMFALSTLQQS